MKKSLVVLTMALFVGMIASPVMAVKTKDEPKKECTKDSTKCTKGEKKACCKKK